MNDEALQDTSQIFDTSQLSELIEQSVPVKKALTELINKCWYTDELVVVYMRTLANQFMYQDYFLDNLGDNFDVVTIEGNVLISYEEVLREIVSEIYEESQERASSDQLQNLLFQHVDELADRSMEFVIQINNAHELSMEVLREIASIVEVQETMVTPHLVLWATLEGDTSLRKSFSDINIMIGAIEVPRFSPTEIVDYLKAVFRGEELTLPFDKESLQQIIRKSGAVGSEIDRLVRLSIYPDTAPEEDERGGFPILQSMVAMAVIALVAMVFFFDNRESEVRAIEVQPIAVNVADEISDQRLAVTSTVIETQENSGVETELIETELIETLTNELEFEIATYTKPSETVAAVNVDEEPVIQEIEVAPITVEEPMPIEPEPLSAYQQQLQGFLAHADNLAFIQLYGTYDETEATSFVENYAIEDKFYYVKTDLNGRNWYIVVYGSFISERAAINELDSLSRKLSEGGPWIRNMASLRNSVKL